MSLSKIFMENVTKRGLSCSQICHPGESCSKFQLHILKESWKLWVTFYAPIALVPFVKKSKGKLWMEFKKSFIHCINMILISYVTGVATPVLICFFSKYFGRIYMSTLIYIPNFIATLSYLPFATQKTSTNIANVVLMVFLESLMREERYLFWKILRDSKLMRTITFMGCSAITLDTMSSMSTRLFWFCNPSIINKNTSKEFPKGPMDRILPNFKNCEHKSSCDEYIWHGSKNIFLAMLGVECIRVIYPNFKNILRNPSNAINILKNKMNFQFATMITAYTTIFRILQCLQNRLQKTPSDYTTAISGFLSGAVYWINGDWSLLCHGMAVAIQFSFQNYFMRWLTSKNKSIANYVNKFPWSKAIFTVLMGYGLHHIVLYPSLCSKLLIKISDNMFAFRLREVSKNTMKALYSTTM